MLANALSILLHCTARLRVNDAPVIYTHKLGNQAYQVVVIRSPDEEKQVA